MARGLIKFATLKPGLLIVPKEHWPPFEGGLSMELDGLTSDGKQLFRYTHSQAYHVRDRTQEDMQVASTLCQCSTYHVMV